MEKAIYVILNLCLCAFTFQPSVGQERSNVLVLSAGIVSSVCAYWYMKHNFPNLLLKKQTKVLLLYLACSGVIVWLSSATQRTAVQISAWTIFLSGIPISLSALTDNPVQNLVLITCALQASYILLSLTYEGLFLLCLTATLFTLIELECSLNTRVSLETMKERRVIGREDVLRSLVLVHFTLVSFFGTGNIASLNSFDPRSIQCLVSVFSPFLMGGLLLLKVLLPFLLVTTCFYAIKYFTRMPSRPLFLLVMFFSDIMGLHFFFSVTDTGSWQEIGTSLSHYVIVEALVIFLQVFFLLSEKLVMPGNLEKEERYLRP